MIEDIFRGSIRFGRTDTFRPLTVNPHPRLDPPGTRPRVNGVDIINPAEVQPEPGVFAPIKEPHTKPKSTAKPKPLPVTAQAILRVLGRAEKWLPQTDIYQRLHDLGLGQISRQCISYHLARLLELGLVQRTMRNTRDRRDGIRRRPVYRLVRGTPWS